MRTASGGTARRDGAPSSRTEALTVVPGADPTRSAAPAVHPVTGLIRQRRSERSTPATRRDSFKVGLSVEGGAMRAVISAAMLNAFQDMDLVSVFDAVYGASGGSMNAAYFLAGPAWHALSLYYDDLMSKEFLDFGRCARGQPPLCLDYVLDTLMERSVPLNWDALLRSEVPLKIVASSVKHLRSTTLSGFSGKAELKLALKASSSIPGLAGPPVPIDDDAFIDAAWQQPHPFMAALEDGCTHVVALSTLPSARPVGDRSVWERLGNHRLATVPGTWGRNRRIRATNYAECKQTLLAATVAAGGPPFVLEVAPGRHAAIPGCLERDVGRVLEGARAGYEAAVLAVEGRTVRVRPRLTDAQDLLALGFDSPTR